MGWDQVRTCGIGALTSDGGRTLPGLGKSGKTPWRPGCLRPEGREEAGAPRRSRARSLPAQSHPRATASARDWGRPGPVQEEPELRGAGWSPTFCSWSLSIEKKKGHHSTTENPKHTHRSREACPAVSQQLRIHTCPPADAAQAPAPAPETSSLILAGFSRRYFVFPSRRQAAFNKYSHSLSPLPSGQPQSAPCSLLQGHPSPAPPAGHPSSTLQPLDRRADQAGAPACCSLLQGSCMPRSSGFTLVQELDQLITLAPMVGMRRPRQVPTEGHWSSGRVFQSHVHTRLLFG